MCINSKLVGYDGYGVHVHVCMLWFQSAQTTLAAATPSFALSPQEAPQSLQLQFLVVPHAPASDSGFVMGLFGR